ncbi:hypothetical protein RchiOBHm_Chr1g0339091 [Rosa chinensis]|uniref:Uncharacterized protein n=1 Tax=Rosa chinensis TaxID=74649 RepID=A0A2P6SD56_ROSCH|nr:hypothetical protein RchiOBHm_Chr1g0339091 [Rosa chinensis]
MRLNHTLLYHPQNPVMAAKTGKTKMMRLLRDDNAEDQDTQRQAERIDMDTHSQIISRKWKQGCQRRSRRLKEASQLLLIEQNLPFFAWLIGYCCVKREGNQSYQGPLEV